MKKIYIACGCVVVSCVSICCITSKEDGSNVSKDTMVAREYEQLFNDTNQKVQSEEDEKTIVRDNEQIKKCDLIHDSFHEDYYVDDKFNLVDYLEEIDSTIYIDKKKTYSRLFVATDIYTKEDSNLIVLPTDYGNVEFEVESNNENPYDIERCRYLGFWNNIRAYLIEQSKGEGYGYRMILTRNKNDIVTDGYPYVSIDKTLCITRRIDAENEVLGTVEIQKLDNLEIVWGGWSDYSLLPEDIVWESDSTILVKSEVYDTENDYYENKCKGYTYGRITLKK